MGSKISEEDRKRFQEDRDFWRKQNGGKDDVAELGPLSDAIKEFARTRKIG